MQIHPVFHVSLLEPAPKGVRFEGTVEIDPEEEEYEVENILDSEERDGEVKYLVKWKGFADEANSWEKRKDISTELCIHKPPARNDANHA